MIDYREIFGISGLASEARDGEGVRIAVLDTGIPNIPDIFVYHSENFTNESTKDGGHATFIGSILFGRGPVKGLCQGSMACFIRVFDRLTARPETVARAIRHAVDSWKCDIINMSLGFSRAAPCPESLKKACQYALSKGVTLVSASGNDGGKSMWPAALPGVICVGSSNGQSREEFSNHGEVDFVVPGIDLEGQSSDGTITHKSGTSFSTALVTGLFALFLAKRRICGQPATHLDIRKDMMNACRDLNTPGWDPDTGFGFPFACSYKETSYALRVGLITISIFDKIKGLVDKVTRSLTRRRHVNE